MVSLSPRARSRLPKALCGKSLSDSASCGSARTWHVAQLFNLAGRYLPKCRANADLFAGVDHAAGLQPIASITM